MWHVLGKGVGVFEGDCLEGMKSLPDNSIDSIVTDPPYGLGFMGKDWDHGVPGKHFWKEMLRVLKPGGYLLAFAGTRTQHRMATNIEDAGFEIRDMIAWVYGSGMPKHQSHLKPALEPITFARKKATKATLLNIDACRIEGRERTDYGLENAKRTQANTYGQPTESANFDSTKGRYPANLIHDGSDEVLAVFPDSNGAGKSLPQVKISGYGDGVVGSGKSEYFGGERIPFDAGTGSAARFFYCAKASKKDRDEGLDGFAEVKSTVGDARPSGDFNERLGKKPTVKRNFHPTVKPTDLMAYLCRLVTPPGGNVLDPFAGSGSTGKAAIREGFKFFGMERDAEYVKIALQRIKSEMEKTK